MTHAALYHAKRSSFQRVEKKEEDYRVQTQAEAHNSLQKTGGNDLGEKGEPGRSQPKKNPNNSFCNKRPNSLTQFAQVGRKEGGQRVQGRKPFTGESPAPRQVKLPTNMGSEEEDVECGKAEASSPKGYHASSPNWRRSTN